MTKQDVVEATESDVNVSAEKVEQRCACPETYPDWDGETIDLGGACVHEMKIASFFHMPVSYDMYVNKQAVNVDQLELTEKWPGLILTKTGMWGGKIIRLIENSDSPSRLVQYLPSPFWVKVKLHHGGIGSVQKVIHQMQIEMVEQGCMPKEWYLAHLTCPLCEERKGGDKILIFRRFNANKRIQERLEKEEQKRKEKEAKQNAAKAPEAEATA